MSSFSQFLDKYKAFIIMGVILWIAIAIAVYFGFRKKKENVLPSSSITHSIEDTNNNK